MQGLEASYMERLRVLEDKLQRQVNQERRDKDDYKERYETIHDKYEKLKQQNSD